MKIYSSNSGSVINSTKLFEFCFIHLNFFAYPGKNFHCSLLVFARLTRRQHQKYFSYLYWSLMIVRLLFNTTNWTKLLVISTEKSEYPHLVACSDVVKFEFFFWFSSAVLDKLNKTSTAARQVRDHRRNLKFTLSRHTKNTKIIFKNFFLKPSRSEANERLKDKTSKRGKLDGLQSQLYLIWASHFFWALSSSDFSDSVLVDVSLSPWSTTGSFLTLIERIGNESQVGVDFFNYKMFEDHQNYNFLSWSWSHFRHSCISFNFSLLIIVTDRINFPSRIDKFLLTF